MNTVCIQCKTILQIQCAYNVSFMNTVCIQCQVLWIQCKFYENSVHTM